MNNEFQQIAGEATGASEIFHNQDIQILWSGYGKIMRYGLRGSDREQVVIKHVKLPDRAHHPRGWNTDLSPISLHVANQSSVSTGAGT
jgi:hypothetical protein